jgi:glycosyltransferase involved in cell wall biosynthesis
VPTTPAASDASYTGLRDGRAYHAWSARRMASWQELLRQRLAATRWPDPPTISVVTAVYATPPEMLRRMVRSVQQQSYPHWELCLVDDGSPPPWNPEILTRLAGGDPRIRIVRRPRNGGIVAASNDALALATGEFVALLDDDDELDPRALYAVAREIVARRDVDAIYTDLDVIDERGLPSTPIFAPAWSPELLLGVPYVVHLTVFRRSLVVEVGGFRPECEGSQDYDLILRLSRHTTRIVHVPQVLYHWRTWSRSAAGNPSAKPYAYAAGIRAITDHLAHGRFGGRREPGPGLGLHTARFQIEGAPLVSVIVTRRLEHGERAPAIERLVHRVSALATGAAYAHCEYVVAVTPGEMAAARAAWRASAGPAIPEPRFVSCDSLTDPVAAANAAADAATGAHLLFLDEALEPLVPDWLPALLELSQQPGIGAVGGQLLDRGGHTWHAGIVVAAGQPRCVTRDDRLLRNFSAVSGACLMTPRATFVAAGGFARPAEAGFSDVDYCLRLRDRGERIVFTPHARLRFLDAPPVVPPAAQDTFRARWGARVDRDPYYNANYRQDDASFGI